MISIVELGDYISVVSSSLLIVFFLWITFFIPKSQTFKRMLQAGVSFETDKSKPPVFEFPSTVRQVLINDCINSSKLINFCYLKENTIKELYYQIAEFQPEKQITKESSCDKANVNGSVKSPVLSTGASYSSTAGQQIETEGRFFKNNSSCCKKIMESLYKNNEIFLLDIEERQINPNIAKTFEECCKTLHNECYAPLPESWLKIYTEHVRKLATSHDGLKKEIEEVAQNKRYILTKGEFKLNGNNILKKNLGNGKILIEIEFEPGKVDRDRYHILEEYGVGNFTILGKIAHWDGESSKLIIVPLAMY